MVTHFLVPVNRDSKKKTFSYSNHQLLYFFPLYQTNQCKHLLIQACISIKPPEKKTSLFISHTYQLFVHWWLWALQIKAFYNRNGLIHVWCSTVIVLTQNALPHKYYVMYKYSLYIFLILLNKHDFLPSFSHENYN